MADLVTPPLWHDEQDGAYGISKKDHLKQQIGSCLEERIMNFIEEKITYCLNKGLSFDDAQHVVHHVVKNIPLVLTQLEDVSDEDE